MNVDYALASTLARDLKAGISHVVVTYDIGCQWGLAVKDRLSKHPVMKGTSLTSLRSWRVAVPKFHLIGHGKSCQVPYNLAYMKHVGMTHGEGVETIWSHSTSLATWSRENGPQARHAILDDHWMGWNWRKLVGLRRFHSSSLLPHPLTSTKGHSSRSVSRRHGPSAKPSELLLRPWKRHSTTRLSSPGRP